MRRLRPPKSLIGWLAPVVLIAFAIFGVRACLSAIETESFEPLRLLKLQVVESEVTPGETATILNGVCFNPPDDDPDSPILVEVYLAAEPDSADPLIQGASIPLVFRGDETGTGRGAIRTIDPGCIASDPITVTVPPNFPLGRWRLFAELVTRGEQGQVQRITATSEYFQVVAR